MAGTQGEVPAQFIVDTLGEPVVASFKVLRSSHGLFTEAVRTALPEMRFGSAELNGRKVRQLVQQPFVFAVAGKEGAAPTTSLRTVLVWTRRHF
jgi:protein TonB